MVSTLLITCVVAAVGAGVGLLVLVSARTWLGKLRRPEDRASLEKLSRVTFPPDVPHSFRRLPVAPPPASVDDSPTAPGVMIMEVERSWRWGPKPARGMRATGTGESSHRAGEVWLKGYMDKLRLVLPGLESDLGVPEPCFELARPVRSDDDGRGRSPGSADATAQVDATTLARIVRDLGEADPVTLVMPEVPPELFADLPVTLCADATVKTAALSLVSDSPPSSKTLIRLPPVRTQALREGSPVRDLGSFHYGARRG
jgi:hypothetical protein